jgi:hypothetical protein
MQQLQLSRLSGGGTSAKSKSKSYQQKAAEAVTYLVDLFTDAVDYVPGEVSEENEIVTLEVKLLNGVSFTINIGFQRSEIRLRPNFPSGILQADFKKARHFVEDLECYLNVAHQW